MKGPNRACACISARIRASENYMALFFDGARCGLCLKPMNKGEALFATSGVWLPPEDILHNFCDAAMHWDCYATWRHRARFAHCYFELWKEAESSNPCWYRCYLDAKTLVTVNPSEPISSACMHL